MSGSALVVGVPVMERRYPPGADRVPFGVLMIVPAPFVPNAGDAIRSEGCDSNDAR